MWKVTRRLDDPWDSRPGWVFGVLVFPARVARRFRSVADSSAGACAPALAIRFRYCFHCNEMCLWVYDQLVWPRRAGDPEPKLHAPPNVRRECEKATQTLEPSPRGAAAVLRLTIEKLCKELGVSGESVKDDIALFVREDVDARVQKVLDAARIIESNAVRPGQIGLGNDRATAETLSGLVNLICEKMIMEPRHLQAVYTKLQEGAGNAMEQRAQGSS